MAMAMALGNPSMALPLRSPFHRKHAFNNTIHGISRFTTNTKLPFFQCTSPPNCRLNSFSTPKSASVNGFSVHNSNPEGSENDQVEFPKRFRELVHFIRSIWPGGSWWSLSDHADFIMTAKPVTVLRALQRMWGLVAKDRWIIFAAFSALVLAAVRVFSLFLFLLEWLEHYIMNGNWEIVVIVIRVRTSCTYYIWKMNITTSRSMWC